MTVLSFMSMHALRCALLLAMALATPGEAATPKVAPNPFDQLNGDWKGGGTIVPANGQPKKVDCQVTYKAAGSNISQNLRCTGNDYEVDTSLKLTFKGGKIKGSWNESVYDASGAVTGTAKDDTIHAKINGDKFSGRMSIKLSDAGHTINILQLDDKSGIYRLATSLSLHR
jgi:hypothetical protein